MVSLLSNNVHHTGTRDGLGVGSSTGLAHDRDGFLSCSAQRLTGGAPEASDAEFHGPGTGAVPETALLRGFKRTGDNPKQVVVRRGSELAVFSVGTDQQNIRTQTHGLHLPVEPDTARGSPALVRRLNMTDKVHLCRNNICTEDATERFTEHGVVKKFNAERFQLSQSQQGALACLRQLWDWIVPTGRKTVTDVVGRIRACL